MPYMAHDDQDRGSAAAAHLAAMTGPIIPAIIFAARRNHDTFSAEEAAKATNFAVAAVFIFLSAAGVRMFVPLVGFLGTLTQWVVALVTLYFCIAGFQRARRGDPAHYPLQIKVVKTHD